MRHGDARLTYAELDARAGRLAATLMAPGVRRGDRVGFFFPKSIPSIVSIFGILKAGGVYVPIDPASPAERVAYAARHCGIRHLMTLRDRLPVLEIVLAAGEAGELEAVILVDESPAVTETPTPRCAKRLMEWPEVLDHAPTPAETGVETDLAYILYTSGSTGAPKGVMISHRAARTFIEWTRAEFGVTSKDIVSSHSPLYFDLSILDVFTTVAAGATIVLVPDRLSTFPVRWAEFIRAQRISVRYSVPSALTLTLQRGKFADFTYPDLRVLVFAGEGAGKLFARGPGLMSGYWGERERSERVLRPNRLAAHLPMERVMATGDIVTVDDDGDFLFVGRRDSMVKSRGYRIELGEVEAALLRCPDAREAGRRQGSSIGRRWRVCGSRIRRDSIRLRTPRTRCPRRRSDNSLP